MKLTLRNYKPVQEVTLQPLFHIC